MKELSANQMEQINGGASLASCGAAYFVGVPLVYALIGGVGGFLAGLIGATVVCIVA
jgi:bacteriocin-like protein